MGDRPVRRPLSTLARLAAGLALLPLGGLTAVVVVAVHAQWWGLVLGLTATVAVLAALPARWWGRTPYGLGWAAIVVVASGGRSEGDYAVSGDLAGYLLLVVVPVVLVVGLLGLRPHRGRPCADSGRQPTTS